MNRSSLDARVAASAAVAIVATQLMLQPVRADEPAGARIAFVSCPIVRDTETVPCWLSEYDGELYYLGIQTDISADFDPPFLGHRVLVEGTAADSPRICGGIVLDPVNVSPMPELDATCNTILPAEDQYTVPFAPRPPGPSGGRLAFAPDANPSQAAPPSEPTELVLYYDFDMLVAGRHSNVLTRAFDAAGRLRAKTIAVTGVAGATLLGDGTLLAEPATLGIERAREIVRLLQGAGLDDVEYVVEGLDETRTVDGVDDWQSRRVVIDLSP
jgi:hypothetical protein